jgi:hypothetical protein
VQTDLPSPKPNRRKRLALRFAALVVALSALGAAYWFTRPPELVLWRSALVGNSGNRIRLLIPTGWKMSRGVSYERPVGRFTQFGAGPIDSRPYLIRRFIPACVEEGDLLILICENLTRVKTSRSGPQNIEESVQDRTVSCSISDINGRITAYLQYSREPRQFNRTYRQICDSLAIE